MVTNATDVGNTFTALANGVVLQIINTIIKFFQQNLLIIEVTALCVSLIIFFVYLTLKNGGISYNYNSSSNKFGVYNYKRGETVAMTKYAKPRPGIKTWG